MSFLDNFFGKQKKTSADACKERLQLIIAHDFTMQGSSKMVFLPKMKDEIIAVINKYIHAQDNMVNFNTQRRGDQELIEIEIAIPDDSKIR